MVMMVGTAMLQISRGIFSPVRYWYFSSWVLTCFTAYIPLLSARHMTGPRPYTLAFL